MEADGILRPLTVLLCTAERVCHDESTNGFFRSDSDYSGLSEAVVSDVFLASIQVRCVVTLVNLELFMRRHHLGLWNMRSMLSLYVGWTGDDEPRTKAKKPSDRCIVFSGLCRWETCYTVNIKTYRLG